jgi:hypothetical protein
MIVELKIESRSGTKPARFTINNLVIAGWSGRDKAAVEKHIVELEALGIARPPTTPVFYRVSAARLTTEDHIQVWGDTSSGEAETVMFADAAGHCFVGLGADHTDRKVEGYNITVSKQMCEKPIASTVWPFAEVEDHWDQLILRSFIHENGKRITYQEGSVAALLPSKSLMNDYSNSKGLAPNTAMFGGTLHAIGGIRPAPRFEAELEDPVLKRTIRFGYDIVSLPV